MLRKVLFVALFALAFVALPWTSTAAPAEEEEDVLVLTDENFEETVKENDILLVEFYAPWCGHCKVLAPEYAKAAKSLKENDPPIRIAKLDATAHSKASENYDVKGFPTLKLFKGSVEAATVKDYDGGRNAEEIVQWMIKKSGPSVTFVQSAAELKELKEENEVVVVALVKSLESDNKLLMEKVADAVDSILIVVTTNPEVLAEEDVKSAPKVVLYKQFDEGKVVYDGKMDQESLLTFINGNKLPLIITYEQEKANMIFGGDVHTHLIMFSDTSKDYHSNLLENAKDAATQNKGKILHIVVPVTESNILQYFALKEEDLPAIMLVNMANGMKKYAYEVKGSDLENKISSNELKTDLVEFENQYFEGSLKPTLKSAEPADDADEAVKIIVGKDFKERVIDSEKDVLLEFYAPWCGHCKNLAPKYEELAEAFGNVESIMIAKFDATENEVDTPGVDVKGFPTILFFGKDKLNPITYDGPREVEGFTEFLKENARKFDLDGESHGKDHDEL